MIIGLIPARLKSSRLPGKPLIEIQKIPLIVHVYKRAVLSKLLDKVIICADDKLIVDIVKKYNCNYLLTSKKFRNGTERIASVAKNINCKYVIDIQCDNLFLNPVEIDNLINFHLSNNHFDIVVPHGDFKYKKDKSAVKIISNSQNKIISMSRSDIPFNYYKKKNIFKRHQDFISFKKNSLLNYQLLKPSKIEKIENIELIRAIENGMNLGTLKVNVFKNIHSINTKKDLQLAKRSIKFCKIRKKYYKNTLI